MRTGFVNLGLKAGIFLSGLILLFAPNLAGAQPYETPDTWGGDILTRPRLTGDWGGLRDDLAKKGVVLDVDLLATPQSVLSGGRGTGGNFWGNVDYTLNIDTQKAGLWPGGFFKFEGDTGFGSNVFHDAGAIVPVNTAALLPAPNDRTSALMNATFTQFLSPQFGLFAGKINTFDLGETEFYGDYHTQFQNTALVIPMTLAQVPISSFGGGIIALPREDIILSGLVLGANGTPTSDSLSQAFSNGVVVVGSGQLTIKPYGLVGHQGLGFTWSDQDQLSLSQDPSNIARLLLTDRFPRLANPGPILTGILQQTFPALLTPTQPANRSNSSWSMYYGFDQYFWQPDGDPKHGIGVFFNFGASDGNPNPIKYSFVTGIGGKGMIPGRADDTYGIGFARTQFSSDFVPFLRQALNLGLEHEDAIEMYYSAALTPWLSATADLQIIDPGLKKTLSPSSSLLLPQLANINTAVVAGTRLRVRF
ncbi:MAG TPA: carbohydrate porin [Stellaceae bacterium]|nr:carbohydrate porin [Stellaceae bacterium]